MLHFTFILSVLASIASAQGADSALPSFAIVSPGATIEPPSSLAAIVTPTPTPVDDDQPAPNDSTLQIPASQSFNPSDAPAFTPVPGVPDPSSNPVFPSTPCSTEATPTSQPGAPSSAASIETPTPQVPSNEEGTPSSASSVALPVPTLPSDNDDEAPCDEEDEDSEVPIKPSGIPFPVPFGTALPPLPTGGRPPYLTGAPFPTNNGRPSDRPGFGWYRPRPSGAWPSRGAPRPSRGFGRPPRPSSGFQLPPRPGKENAATTPCTLETRVRPTPTVLPRH